MASLSFLFGFIGSLIGLIGWFGFHSVVALVIGVVLYAIETILEWGNLNSGAKIVDIVIFGIGCLMGVFISTPFYISGMILLLLYSFVMSLGSVISFIRFMF